MSRDETPEITPQVVHLIDLLKRAREGRLRVPQFQRDFVWRRQDIVDLFDSIAKQYPIGTLFLWGAEPPPHSRPRIGPLKLPDFTGERFLVLDGQQRLTALVGVLLAEDANWSSSDGDDPDQWKLYYDAENQNFTHPGREPNPAAYVPVTALMDTVSLFNLMQTMSQSAGTEKVGIETWIKRAQEVARALQGYRIPIVEIKTNSLSIAVESFSRLNKKGRTIGQDEMFSALTYDEGSSSFHLASEIDSLQRAMVQSGFGEVERSTLLRAVLTAAGLDMYRTDWIRLGDQLKVEVRGKLPQAVQEAQTGLAGARQFLESLGVLNARMLPYSMQLVALSAFFGRCTNPSPAQQALLRRWFWVSSFAGWFGAGNPAKVRRLVDELRDEVATNPSASTLRHLDLDQPALPTPLRFDLRSARVRAMLCVLLARRPQQPDGAVIELEETAKLLFERGPEAMSVLCATVQDDDLRRSPANRILDLRAPDGQSKTWRGQAKTWLLQVNSQVRDAVLESHAIPATTFSLLQSDDNDGFLRARLDEIARIEREFMQREWVTPPESNKAAPSPIDTDDVAPLGSF